jgi:dUTP pyrophosphatase
VKIPVLRLDPSLPLPQQAHRGDGGVDLRAAEDVELQPGERALVPTGIAVAIPEGHAGLVTPRSGLAVRHGVTVLNGPGLVDAGYRGELKVALVNLGGARHLIERGERIAQLVVVAVAAVELVAVDSLPDSPRGEGGFGSTGSR